MCHEFHDNFMKGEKNTFYRARIRHEKLGNALVTEFLGTPSRSLSSQSATSLELLVQYSDFVHVISGKIPLAYV